ncbi:hypothetical protein [Nereida sp. MMG025]|uniref:hypothetical protein n=1 Tax=Nereida sp. MMG025 TaxID=2909981 RepID=UPI001F1BC187|nr:hypothetical protein [Nereida sp. MMG025]MCF6443495.1 hypothetical protein [Nereida sp. MMG025]
MSNMTHKGFDEASKTTALETDLQSTLAQVRFYEKRITDLLDDINNGVFDDAPKIQNAITSLLRAKDATIAERARLYDKELKQQGKHSEHDIDFDAARTALGCRLAKLRTCCHAKRLSE